MKDLTLEQRAAVNNLFSSTIQDLHFNTFTHYLNSFAELTDYAYPFCEDMKVLGFDLDSWEVVRDYINNIEE